MESCYLQQGQTPPKFAPLTCWIFLPCPSLIDKEVKSMYIFNQSCLRWGLYGQAMTQGLESASYLLHHVLMLLLSCGGWEGAAVATRVS